MDPATAKSGQSTQTSTAGVGVSERVIGRTPITLRHSLLIALSVLACLIGSSESDAADRSLARFRKMLKGKQDAARVMAMRSVVADFQIRVEALPIVVEAIEDLAEDSRFRRASERGLPDLPDGVVMMIDFIASVDRPESDEALIALLDCEYPSWVMATTNALAKYKRTAAIEKLSTLVDHESFEQSYGFRFGLARALRQMEHPDAIEALATIYDRIDGQLAHRLRQEFGKVTADDFENDLQRFTSWRNSVGLADPEAVPEEQLPEPTVAQAGNADGKPSGPDGMSLPKKMSLGPAKSAASYHRDRHLTPSKYYGIDIYAKRLLFVLDRSGSMNTPTIYQTRIQRAKQELITAISGLDERCEFGVLIFDTDVRGWRDALVEATESNKKEAIQYVQKLSAGRSTNTYAALRTSIDFDEQLEAVFVLTDGEPTCGLITNPATILNDILRRNETRHITINTIAIAVDPLMQGFLRKLTEPSEGEFRVIR